MPTTLSAPCRVYLGTEEGLRTARLTRSGLDPTGGDPVGGSVRALDVHPSDPDDVFVGCGLRGHGLYHTEDGGSTLDAVGFDEEWVWGVTRPRDDPETVYVGTEPPMVYVSTDGGETFDRCGGIENLPSRPDWTFFHEPFYAGHVHGFAVHPDRPDRVLAGVEQCAVVVSPDRGDTWTESLVGSDVHRVAVHPTDPDRVYAATGSGLYVSDDGGREWIQAPHLRDSYLHALAFHPDDPGRMYAYAADEDSPVFESEDGGETWHPIADGLPAARPADTLRIHPEDPETLVYVGDPERDESRLHLSTDGGDTWHCVGDPLPKVWRLALAPVEGR